MSEEKRDRLVVQGGFPQWQGERKPIIPRGPPPRPQEEIDSLADKVAENRALMQLVNSTRGSNDNELAWRVLERVEEEIRQIDPTARNTDGARVLLTLAARAHGIKVGGR